MKFKIDENLPADVVVLLKAAGHDACTVHDQRLTGSVDENLIKVCQQEQRVLITWDLDFSDIRKYPPQEYFGIIVMRNVLQSRSRSCRFVQNFLPLLTKEPLIGQLWIVEETRIRIRE